MSKAEAKNVITIAASPVYHDRLRTHNVFGNIFRWLAPDQDTLAGGDNDDTLEGDAADDKADKKKKPAGDKAAKVEMTQAELDEKMEAAAEAAAKTERERLATDAETKRKADEAAAAKKKGEWEALYNTEKQRADDAEGKLKQRDHADAIRAAVNTAAKPHDGYAAALFDEYVTTVLISKLTVDTKPEDVKKAAKAAVEKYVTDNPRQPKKATPGPIGQPRNGVRREPGEAGEPNKRPAFSGATATM